MKEYSLDDLKPINNQIRENFTKIQNARGQIAKPYIFALKKQFPNSDTYRLIEIADTDLQKSNPVYQKLTNLINKLTELQNNEFARAINNSKEVNSQLAKNCIKTMQQTNYQRDDSGNRAVILNMNNLELINPKQIQL